MFIRDMVELKVWPALSNYEQIDVASDINTMKLALRTRVLQTEIPLLSSFLDVFCYQYACIDEMSASAWRAVWEEWRNIDAATAPRSPCRLDFLLYRIGREYCKDNVVEYKCERGHVFYKIGAVARVCEVCRENKVRAPVQQQRRLLPCQINALDLPLLKETNLLHVFNGVCIFEPTCDPKDPKFRILDPPKSISIKGQTSWTNSTADRDRGGGGMMG